MRKKLIHRRADEGIVRLAAAAARNRAVAILAVHRLVRPRRERYLRCYAALRADCVEHHSLARAAAAIPLASPAALGAPGRLVLEALLRIELLFAARENEFSAAVTAGQRPILKSHD